MGEDPIFIILEPVGLENGQTLFIIEKHVFSASDKGYKRKSQTLQVRSMQFSGVTYPSTLRISMALITYSNAIMDSSALFAFLTQSTLY